MTAASLARPARGARTAAGGDLCSPRVLPLGREAGFWPRGVLLEWGVGGGRKGGQGPCSGGAGLLFVFLFLETSASSVAQRKSWKDWRLGPDPVSVASLMTFSIPLSRQLATSGKGRGNGLGKC